MPDPMPDLRPPAEFLGGDDRATLKAAGEVLARLAAQMERLEPIADIEPPRAQDHTGGTEARVVPYPLPPIPEIPARETVDAAEREHRAVVERLALEPRFETPATHISRSRRAAAAAAAAERLLAADLLVIDVLQATSEMAHEVWQSAINHAGPFDIPADGAALVTQQFAELAPSVYDRAAATLEFAKRLAVTAKKRAAVLEELVSPPLPPPAAPVAASQRDHVIAVLEAVRTPISTELLVALLATMRGVTYDRRTFGRLRANERRRVEAALARGQDKPDRERDRGWIASVLDEAGRPVRGMWRLASRARPLVLPRHHDAALGSSLARMGLALPNGTVDPVALLELIVSEVADRLNVLPPDDRSVAAVRAWLLDLGHHDPDGWQTTPRQPGYSAVPAGIGSDPFQALFGVKDPVAVPDG